MEGNTISARLCFWKPKEGGYVHDDKVFAVSRDRSGLFPLSLVREFAHSPRHKANWTPDNVGEITFTVEKKIFLRGGRDSKGVLCYMESKRGDNAKK